MFLKKKYKKTAEKVLKSVEKIMSPYQKAAVAFSGGADSTLLAFLAARILGRDKVQLFTALTETISESSYNDACETADLLDLKCHTIQFNVLENPSVTCNDQNRCYHCKSLILKKIKKKALGLGFDVIFDGTNYSDLSDFRPGMKALKENHIVSPFLETGILKKEIKEAFLFYQPAVFWKSPESCLATRIALNEPLTVDLLKRIEGAEKEIKKLGFSLIRVRVRGDDAAIEVFEKEIKKAFDKRVYIDHILKRFGFSRRSICLRGYQMGS